MERFYLIILYFYIYSFIGWVIEMFFFFVTQKKVVNCGLLHGPYCPIYGCAGILILLFFHNYLQKPVLVFLICTFLCTLIEYISSYIIEKTLGFRIWDYSNIPFNVKGRICLRFSIMFGILCVFATYFFHPHIEKLVNFIYANIFKPIILFGLILLIIDFIISSYKFWQLMEKMKKDNYKNKGIITLDELKNS